MTKSAASSQEDFVRNEKTTLCRYPNLRTNEWDSKQRWRSRFLAVWTEWTFRYYLSAVNREHHLLFRVFSHSSVLSQSSVQLDRTEIVVNDWLFCPQTTSACTSISCLQAQFTSPWYSCPQTMVLVFLFILTLVTLTDLRFFVRLC